MRHKVLIISTYALAAMTLLSVRPASANPGCEPLIIGGTVIPCDNESETVPEPGTLIGTVLVGSAMAWKKYSNSKKA